MTDVYMITAHIKRDEVKYVVGAAWTLEAAGSLVADFASRNQYEVGKLWATAGRFGEGAHTWIISLSKAPEPIPPRSIHHVIDYVEITKATIVEATAVTD